MGNRIVPGSHPRHANPLPTLIHTTQTTTAHPMRHILRHLQKLTSVYDLQVDMPAMGEQHLFVFAHFAGRFSYARGVGARAASKAIRQHCLLSLQGIVYCGLYRSITLNLRLSRVISCFPFTRKWLCFLFSDSTALFANGSNLIRYDIASSINGE
jgi:hypothetical protein